MLKINYNNNHFDIEENINGFQLVKILDKELSKEAVALKLNDKLVDLSAKITDNATVELITTTTTTGTEIIRYSCAHLLAKVIKELRKDAKIAIGTTCDNGFYYDFDVDTPFSENELEGIEKKFNEEIKKEENFVREEVSKAEAIELFKKLGETYKVEILEGIKDEKVSLYKSGNFVDLCRGPMVPNLKMLKNCKMAKVAGAYWKGDSNNKMLQRIYGYAFATKELLEQYLDFLKEAEKRDHRKICKLMDLVHFEPDFAPGAPFFHQKGLYMYNKLIEYMRGRQERDGYIEIATPRVMDRSLWETSGHWQKYGEHNYSGKTEDGRQFCIKPMNCPGSILTFKQGIKSYRDLPMKIAEFGKVNRYEASGSLYGLLRVREFTQDDAHVYCTVSQMDEQCKQLIEFLLDTYKDLGFDDVRIKLSTRPEKRIGSDEIWDKSEKALADALKELNLPFTIFEGEGAFYGPKLEFVLYDCLGRDWQMGTIQLDMNLPERFDVTYIDENGQKQRPIMFHRAILGSIERFLGILIEQTEGKIPLWLNPMQIAVANISEDSKKYAEDLHEKFVNSGFKATLDTSNEKISYKIRDLSLQKIPYILVVGKNEKTNHTVSVRILGSEETIEMPVDKFIEKLNLKIKLKERDFNL